MQVVICQSVVLFLCEVPLLLAVIVLQVTATELSSCICSNREYTIQESCCCFRNNGATILRNDNADFVVGVLLKDKFIVTSTCGLETNVYVTLQPPSSATTIFHRSFTLITIPSGIGAEHFNDFELIVIITP